MNIELSATTGTPSLDDLLRALLTRFETSSPGRIRSYYLGGSSSDGTAVVHDQSPNSTSLPPSPAPACVWQRQLRQKTMGNSNSDC